MAGQQPAAGQEPLVQFGPNDNGSRGEDTIARSLPSSPIAVDARRRIEENAELMSTAQITSDRAVSRKILSILIPVYNEQGTLATLIGHVLAASIDLELELVAVDDGSSDGSWEELQRVGKLDERVRIYRHPRNLGKAAAIRTAIEHMTGDIAIVQDADLEYDPRDIPEVLAPIIEGQADVVYGSRFMVRRAARVLYFYHYLANRFLTLLSNVLTNRNMTDIETCYKAFRAGVIKPLKLTSKGFGMEVEITAMVCKTKARTYEVPISYYGRTYEEGKKIGFWDGVKALYYILYYNLVQPWLPAGRAYIREANRFLEGNKQ
jgi:glycosyltransferase involved in cell wall biosynthesis